MSGARTRIKVCCIASIDEARMAAAAGADAIGLVSAMPSGPGVIDDQTIRAIAMAAPPPVAPWLLTSLEDGADIAEQAIVAGAAAVQCVRHLSPYELAILRDEAPPALKIVQVVHVEGPDAFEIAGEYAPLVDAILLDSGRIGLQELGGTGRVHDWTVSRMIVAALRKPVFLAGGLRPDTVGAAIRAVRPFGVDLCTGVRTNGALDPARLSAFAAAVADA